MIFLRAAGAGLAAGLSEGVLGAVGAAAAAPLAAGAITAAGAAFVCWSAASSEGGGRIGFLMRQGWTDGYNDPF